MKLSVFGLLCGMLLVSMTLALRAQSKNQPESVYAELERAPEKYQQMRNPVANDPEAPAAGAVLFEEHCESCHGKDAVGG